MIKMFFCCCLLLDDVSRKAVSSLLSSHKQKCFCKYEEDVINDKVCTIYTNMIQPYKMSSLFGDFEGWEYKSPASCPKGLCWGLDYRAKA